MSDDRHLSIKPRLPLFWEAIYPEHVRELRIPVCRACGNLIKVSSYASIVCPNTVEIEPTAEELTAMGGGADQNRIAELVDRNTTYRQCGSQDISFDEGDGALVVPLQFGVLNEFDEDGNEPLNFRYLPTDGLQAFGLIDPIVQPPTFYLLNLRSGNLEIGNVNTGVAIPIGIGIEFPTRDGTNIIPISMVLERYGQGGSLIHYKHGCNTATGEVEVIGGRPQIRMFDLAPGSQQITNITVGYKCQIPGWNCQVKINVECSTHIPFITTKATRVDEA